jgi:putative phosphoesterase
MIRVGLISDTHGHLRPEAIAFLRGSDYIIHSGDVGSPSILTDLAVLAPLTAVRGNNDHGSWADGLRQFELLAVGEVRSAALDPVALLSQEDH